MSLFVLGLKLGRSSEVCVHRERSGESELHVCRKEESGMAAGGSVKESVLLASSVYSLRL